LTEQFHTSLLTRLFADSHALSSESYFA